LLIAAHKIIVNQSTYQVIFKCLFDRIIKTSTYPGDHRDAHEEAKHTEAASEEDCVEFALAQDGKLVNYTRQHGLNDGELYMRR